MSQDIHRRVVDRAEETVGHLPPILVEGRVHRRDDQIELGQTRVRQIECAIRLDVALDARQQPDPPPFGGDRAESRGMIGSRA